MMTIRPGDDAKPAFVALTPASEKPAAPPSISSEPAPEWADDSTPEAPGKQKAAERKVKIRKFQS